MSAGNGNSKDGFVEVEGNAVPARRTKAPKPPARARDQHLPGLEPKTVPSVHKAIEEYVIARDHRMELTKVEIEKKAHLMRVMKDAGMTVYNVDGHEATLDVEETIKARLRDPEDEDAEPVGTFVETVGMAMLPDKGTKPRKRRGHAEASA